MRNNIFLAISNKKAVVSIAKILISEGMKIASAAKSIADVRGIFSYYGGGIVITNYNFDGVNINTILDETPENFTIILIGNKDQLDNCYDDRVFKLAVPLHKNDLVCAIDMLNTLESAYHPGSSKTSEEEKLIIRAKQVLIDTYSMTEEQAHRYIQKKSMDTGRKLVDIAKIIIEV